MECNKIENYDALVRRANKMVDDFNQYPLMTDGGAGWSLDPIRDVFNYNPLFVLARLKKSVMDMLLEKTDYRYDEKDLLPILEETYEKKEKKHCIRIMEILINNFKKEMDGFRFKHDNYMDLRKPETKIFYYAYSVFYISKKINNASGMFVARNILKALELIQCERNPDNPIIGIKRTGKMLNLREFNEDRTIYEKLLHMIETEIENSSDEETKAKLTQTKQKENKKKGCYVATCVYGSYDCPQVWTLRRYRDFCLSDTVFGRLFIKVYYKVSPFIVRRFGKSKIFKCVCKAPLELLLKRLHRKGYEDTPYEDD
ncbi:MAG: hypothetical protein IKU25_03800 [Clostridia bacterium]|nr:hypothetical protein [Clostridia bacterium]